MPWVERVEELPAVGDPIVLVSNTQKINDLIAAWNKSQGWPPSGGGGQGGSGTAGSGQGGNAGAQSLAVVMRGLVLREVRAGMMLKVIRKEVLLGALNGVITGIITAVIAWLWHGNPYLGLVIGLAMIVNLMAAGLAGAAIPLTMKSLGFDPAQSSSIILTTVTDIVGFFSFLGFATLFQAYLM